MVKLVKRDWAPKPKRVKVGVVPPNKIGVYDHQLNRRGHVGLKASAVTAERFGVHNATLQRVRGAPAWVGEGPKARPRVSAINHGASVKAARGSGKRRAYSATGATLAEVSSAGATKFGKASGNP